MSEFILCLLLLMLVSDVSTTAGQDIRDKFSGAVEAFSRRNGSGHGDHSRQRSPDNVPSSKEVVSCRLYLLLFDVYFLISIPFFLSPFCNTSFK